MRCLSALAALVVLVFGFNAMAWSEDTVKPDEDATTVEQSLPQWELVAEEADFSPRDTAEDCVYDGKMWLSNGYYHGSVLHRDLYSSTDGVRWEWVNMDTPYRGYSEFVAHRGKMWAIKKEVWTSTDGVEWEQVCEQTPFGNRGYGEAVVFDDKIWQLGSGDDVYCTEDGVNWTCVTDDAPYGNRACTAVAAYDGKLWVCGGRIKQANDPPEEGYEDYTSFNDVWCSENGKDWTRVVEHAPWAPRMWFIAKVYRGRLWIIGGYDNVHHKNFGDVWYTDDGENWTKYPTENAFSPRHEPTCYVYDDSLWVIAGNEWPVRNDAWRLSLPEGW
jgi:hypothetical protein